jgi:hypothetical protein
MTSLEAGAWLALVVALGVIGLALRSRLLRLEGDLYVVSAPPATRSDPEHFFRGLHGLLRPPLRRLIHGQPWLTLEFVGVDGQIQLQVWIPRGDKPLIESLLRAAYPGAVLTPADRLAAAGQRYGGGQGHLTRGNDLPIRMAFDGEPLSSLLWTHARVPQGSMLLTQLLVRPRPNNWQRKAERRAQALRDRQRVDKSLFRPTRVLAPSRADRDRAKAIEQKADGLGFDCVLRVSASAPRGRDARELVRSVGAGLRVFSGENGVGLRSVWFFAGRFDRQVEARQFPLGGGAMLLTAEELAGLWHVPSGGPPQLEALRVPALPVPRLLAADARTIGIANWGSDRRQVGISVIDARSHLHLLGSTGTGKTTALQNLALQDIVAGRGVAVLDPKGDLVRGLLERIPAARKDDVILITPDDAERSVGINPLELWPGDDRELVADNVLVIFKRIYERYWGPRTDDVLKSALLTLLRQPSATLAHIPVLLTDADARERLLRDVSDPLGLDGFWAGFNRMSESQRAEAIGPVLNKLRDFLLRPRLRRVLCQPHSTIDLRDVVDGGKILLADLSVGRWGDATSELIGSFLVARIWQAILRRSAVAEAARPDFFLYVDEFQHFLGVSGPFADVLAEARSLRLSLTIANQHLGQLTRDLRDAVASNARSRLVFQCGQDDAAYLAHQFAPLDQRALMSLDRFEAAARIAIAGRSSEAFTLRTLPPAGTPDPEFAETIRAASAERFGRPVAIVDQELEAAVGVADEGEAVDAGRLHRA